MKRIFVAMIIAMIMLGACSDDDTASTSGQVDFHGNAVSLKGATLYLITEASTGSGHTYRNYFITDGDYIGGTTGWELNDFHEATYVLGIQLAVPNDEEAFTTGNYPLYSSANDVPDDSNLSWVSFKTGDDVDCRTPGGTLGGDPVLISGSFENGTTMNIEFNGMLEQNTEGGTEEVEVKFYFKGKVKDLSSL